MIVAVIISGVSFALLGLLAWVAIKVSANEDHWEDDDYD